MLRLWFGLFLVVAVGADAVSSLRTYGTIRQLVGQRDAKPKVELADLLREPHSYGLGSLSELRGEITILDGTAWLSYPPAHSGDLPRVVAARTSHESAAFLVAAHIKPAAWRKVRIDEPLTSDRFDATLTSLLTGQGTGAVAILFASTEGSPL